MATVARAIGFVWLGNGRLAFHSEFVFATVYGWRRLTYFRAR